MSTPQFENAYEILPASPHDLSFLPAIERRAASRFSLADLPQKNRERVITASELACAQREGRLWIARERAAREHTDQEQIRKEQTSQPVGFALASIFEDTGYLEEIDVLPEHSGKGLGRRLLTQVCQWARARGFLTVHLTTFRHVPWNAPLYERCGFRALDSSELTPGLQHILNEQASHGYNPADRIAMRFDLHYISNAGSPECKFAAEEFRNLRSVIPIQDCGEELVELPQSLKRFHPHPYQALGAPYGAASPFVLRQGVVQRLEQAARRLTELHPGYHLKIWDGYRPVSVQSFMLNWTTDHVATKAGKDPRALTENERRKFRDQALLIWAMPNTDPRRPPPHSTGSAVDLTIVDGKGYPLPMGSEIDALPPHCLPHHYARSMSAQEQSYHSNRELLYTVMRHAGFHRLPIEWWHFSFGDQSWVCIERLLTQKQVSHAQYGRVETLDSD